MFSAMEGFIAGAFIAFVTLGLAWFITNELHHENQCELKGGVWINSHCLKVQEIKDV